MGEKTNVHRPLTPARGAALLVSGLLVSALVGCAAPADAARPVPTVTVTATAEPAVQAWDGMDASASYTCGRYSALLSIGWTMQWHHDRGELSEEAYDAFLGRQAFQLFAVQTDVDGLAAPSDAARTYLDEQQAAAGVWTFDPASPEWVDLEQGLRDGCLAAGSATASWAEPEMGG